MSAVSYALTTRDRFKDFAGITGSSDDSVIDILISAATDFIEHFCKRRFMLTTYTQELYSGDDSGTLLLKNFPVVGSITLQYRNSNQNVDDWSTVDSKDFIVDANAGIIEGMGGWCFREGTNNFRVTYQAGYDFDNATDYLADVGAADLELACWDLVKNALKKRKGDSNIQSERLREYSVTYFNAALFENDVIKAILEKYQKLEAAGQNTPFLY